jgi:NTP pyrophosphatase (non-canonical NTP hydrolase)
MVTTDSLKELQAIIDKWIRTHGGYWSPLSMVCAIMEEVGEVAREINSLEGYKPKKSEKEDSKLREELADLTFSILCIANYYKIDLGKLLISTIDKYSKRDSERFI